jgi:uncharacterized protein involved in copper resistance
MSMSTLKQQVSALIISALLTFPSFAIAQGKEPATATSPSSSQHEDMDKMDHKGMNHGEMGHKDHKEMMNKKGGMQNKAADKTPPETTNDTTSEQHTMPMNNDM